MDKFKNFVVASMLIVTISGFTVIISNLTRILTQ